MELNGSLRIAVQSSGRLSEGSLQLLRSMGLQFETYERRLFARCRNLPIDVLFLRDDDIPEYVQDGVCDLGIVGQNVLRERGSAVDELLPLDFGYCRLSIAVPDKNGSTLTLGDLNGKRIATSYPRILESFLAEKGIAAEAILLKGCVEVAPALQVADAICDLVSTGSTIQTNRLMVIEDVLQSQATLIGSSQPSQTKKKLIDQLLLRARGVQEAKRTKYIMFNLPRESVEEVSSIVPGSKSPTVLPLADPQFVAVHSVVFEEDFWETVEAIKSCGGSDILISSIEKFVR